MSQHDYTIDNASGSAVRADLNSALQASASANSGTSEPSTNYPYQVWADTTANKLKIRNGANNAWYVVGSLDTANLGLMLASFFPNVNSNVTATDEELNILDGFSGVTADLTYAKDLRATGVTTTEFDKLDGLTASTTELNLLSGKTTLDTSFTSTSAMSINSAHGSLQEQNIMVVSDNMMMVSGLIYTAANIGTNPTLSITVSGYTVGFGHGTCSGHDYGLPTGVDGGYVAEAHNTDGFYVYPRLSDQTQHYVYFHAMFRV